GAKIQRFKDALDKSIGLFGSSSRSGNPAFNVTLSLSRAVEVANFLGNHGVPVKKFQFVEGKGSDPNPSLDNEDETARRVDIQVFYNPDLVPPGGTDFNHMPPFLQQSPPADS